MRSDYSVIRSWVAAKSRVLDLGCGDGSLLKSLANTLDTHGYGIEISEDDILQCIDNGINVVEQNIDDGLSNFEDQSFDTVIMSQAIQTMQHPHKALAEMLRVGRQCIVTFPNFGHWRSRFHLAFTGRMPVSDRLPYEWYDTPNIHFCTFKDFESLCEELNLNVLNKKVEASSFIDTLLLKFLPNLFGETILYRINKQG